MNIMRQLTKLGLKGSRAKVYVAILELGQATVIDIAKRVGFKRTTVYDVVLDLTRDGYVNEAQRGKRRVFIAEDPTLLLGRLEEKLFEMKELIPLLTALRAKAVPRPVVRFYNGGEGCRMIMEEILAMQGKEQLWWSRVGDLVDLLGNHYLTQWVKRRVRRKITARILLTPTSGAPKQYLESGPKHLRTIHWLPSNIVVDGVLGVFDNKVAYIASSEESFGFIVESKEFTTTLRQIFELMWLMTNDKR